MDLAFEHIQVCSWVVVSNYITATITGETSLFMILENPYVYISKRVCDSVCDSSSIWTSIMIPWAREFLQCYIFVLAICGGLCYVAKAKLCVSRLFRFYLVFGGWGRWTNLTIFYKDPLFCNCRWLLVPFYECFCRMWTCCTSSGLELKTRKVSKICTELFIVVYDGH